MKIKSVLSQGAFWQINKSLAQKVGLESALLLSDLIDRESYFEGRDMLIDINGEGYFFVTSKQISDATTLSYRKQKKCIAVLEDEGMIKTFLRGVPAKLHFTICESKIWQSVNTSISETLKLDLAKTQNKSERNAKTINNNKELIIKNNNKEQYKKVENYFDNILIDNLFKEFLILRVSLKAKNTDRAVGLILKKLEGLSPELQTEMLEQSIENSWKSVFPIKKQFNKAEPTSLSKHYFPDMFKKEENPLPIETKILSTGDMNDFFSKP
jgi:hypothetical protein